MYQNLQNRKVEIYLVLNTMKYICRLRMRWRNKLLNNVDCSLKSALDAVERILSHQ